MKVLNNLVSFLLELAMLAAFSFWGFQTGQTTPIKWILALGIPLIVVVFWGAYMAPMANNRLPWPWLPFVSLVLFLLSALALYVAGRETMAIALAVVAAVNGALVLIWHQY